MSAEFFDAIRSGDVNRVATYLSADIAGLETRSVDRGYTPIIMAAEHGHLHVIELLVGLGANILATSDFGSGCVLCAMSAGHIHVVTYLLLIEPNWLLLRPLEASELCILALRTNDLKSLRLLAEIGYDFNDISNYLLARATIDCVVWLTNVLGIDVQAVDDQGITALHYAARNNCWETFYQLIYDCSADVNALTNSGMSPLIMAANRGNVDILKLLIYVVDNIHIRDRELSRTAIQHAIANGHLSIVKMMMKVVKYSPSQIQALFEFALVVNRMNIIQWFLRKQNVLMTRQLLISLKDKETRNAIAKLLMIHESKH